MTAILFPLSMFMNGYRIGTFVIGKGSIIIVGSICGIAVVTEKLLKTCTIAKELEKLCKTEERLQITTSKYSSLCAQARSLFKVELKTLHKELHLNNQDVVTLYIEKEGILHQHTRFSPSIQYNNPSCHACNFGVLDKIWKEKRWFDNKFPTAKKADYLQYARQHYNMNDRNQKALSRIFHTYFGVSIVVDGYAFAVLLVESNRTDIDETETLQIVTTYAMRIEKYFSVFKKDTDVLAPFTGENE